MAQTIENQHETPKGRGRGLLMVWRRELEKKLQINRYLSGKSRGATSAIMAQMDQCPGRRLGVDKVTYCDLDHGDIESTTTWYRQMGPRTEEPPKDGQLHDPGVWVGVPQLCSFRPPLLTPSTTFSNSLGPPSP